MITENGIVTRTSDTAAWIKTTRNAACEACSARNSCGSGHGSREMILEVPNTLDVKEGDQVVIGIETGPVLMLTFLVYVVPILALVAGALTGNILGPVFNFNASASAMITGFSFFGIAFLIIRKKSSHLNQKEGYKPFLIRKKNSLVSAPCQPGLK